MLTHPKSNSSKDYITTAFTYMLPYGLCVLMVSRAGVYDWSATVGWEDCVIKLLFCAERPRDSRSGNNHLFFVAADSTR